MPATTRITTGIADVVLWALFIGSILCTATAWYFFVGIEQQAASYGAMAVSLIWGVLLTKREPVRTWLRTPAVLGFLAVVNMVAAVVVLLIGPGIAAVIASVFLGVVGIGAVVGLVLILRARKAAVRPAAAGSGRVSVP